MKDENQKLRTGWTTGACATAGAAAAAARLMEGHWPETVTISLPKGETPTFPLARTDSGEGWAEAGIVKDAGDDPDVTHGATVVTRVAEGAPGLRFHAGEGVGTVTRAGLPIPPGEAAINPKPREMIEQVLREAASRTGTPFGFDVTVSIPGGEEMARHTMNGRLGIVGGLSILGTTGIVRPFSCSAWIASIHRGIDVARSAGQAHVVGATGSTSEKVAASLYDLPDFAFLDMGDFAGGMLKYLRRNPVPRLTVAGGIGKMTKLAQGAMDLHSGRSRVDFLALGALASDLGLDGERIAAANTALEAAGIGGPVLAEAVARGARDQARRILGDACAVETIVIDRAGTILARERF